MASFAARTRGFFALVALITASLVLTGCTGTWSGKGNEVADAIDRASEAKSGKFSGSMQMKMTGGPPELAANGDVTLVMTGATDSSDPKNPRMWMEIEAVGQAVAMRTVMPGDGKVYMTSGNETFSIPVPLSNSDQYAIDNARLLAALGSAVGGFKKSQPMVNIQGQSVPAISAKVNRGKLCGSVLAAMGNAFNAGAGSGAADLSKSLGGEAGKGLEGVCKSMLRKDPNIWFGITDGTLTDVALTADVVFPFGVAMSLTGQYHMYDLDQSIGRIKAPANAIEVGSFEEMQARAVEQAKGNAPAFGQ